MKKLIIIIPALFMFLGMTAQNQQGSKELQAATMLMHDYLEAATFESNTPGETDPIKESIFKNCFGIPTVIFDIPVTTDNLTGKRDDPLQNEYLKYVTVNRYINLVKVVFDRFNINRINYQYIITAADTTMLGSQGIALFEVEKRFTDTTLYKQIIRRFLYEVSIINDDEPKITAVRVSTPDPVKNDVVLRLDTEASNLPERLKEIYNRNIQTRIIINHEENIFDREILETFDSTGKINLGMISARARLLIDTAFGPNGEKFTVPYDWKYDGKPVANQPPGGFPVPLKPFRWNGSSFTAQINAGMVMQTSNNLVNFSPDTQFDNKPGYSFGAVLLYHYFFNSDNWRKDRKNWIYGFGTGINFNYTKYSISSKTFNQHAYPFSDRSGDTCDILISGKDYEETLGTVLFKVPVFGEVRKKFHHTILGIKSFSLQAGANFMIPFLSRSKYEGSFSRHGRYPQYNNQLITEDQFYNYYTDEVRDESDALDYNNFMIEGMVRINGFIPLSNRDPNHSIVVGLEFRTPFSKLTARNTSNYLINQGNDDFSSLAYAKEKIYEYYFGISIGVNIINYRPD